MKLLYNKLLLLMILAKILGSCSGSKENWTILFNGINLEGWETYIGPPYDPDLARFGEVPIGLNQDPDGVFSVVTLDNEAAIRISGKHFGGISTLEEYENYHLQLQFRWGDQRWPPRENHKRDSGILYHANGPHAGDGRFWMRSQEFQVQETDCGDYWGVAGAIMDIRAIPGETRRHVYNKDGDLLTFSVDSPYGRSCQKYPDAELPSGEWNTLDLYCLGTTSMHVVNGVLTMVLENSRQKVDGIEVPLTRGKIQIQSEGAEVYYRGIRIRAIDALPVF